VTAIPLRIPFSAPFTIAAPHEQTRDHIDVMLVQIDTNEGVSGIGETQAWRRQASSEVLLNLVRVVEEIFKPILMGRNPLEISGLLHELNCTVYNSLYAQAAVGDALYDLVAKAFNLPVCELLGGRCRGKIQVGLPLSISSSTEAMLEKARQAYAQGYRHLRVKIGMDPVLDVANVRQLRQEFGDKIVLRADANGGMHHDQALPLLKKLEAFDLDIVEQPVPAWDLDSMALLARTVNIPLSADESVSTDTSLIEIIKRRAASIIQTKVGKNGGIHYTRKLWTIADAAGIGIFPGNHPATSIAAASVAHLCAAWPSLRIVGDFQAGACDMLGADIVKSPLEVHDGYVIVPDGPGLGMELDQEKIRKFRVTD
jgi:muconate cycloisomerase